MDHLPHDLHDRDVYQWLGQGWCLVNVDGTPLPATLDSVEDEQSYIYCSYIKQTEDHKYRTFGAMFDREDVRPHWPRCGSINIPGLKIAVYLRRYQQRQYRRTYNGRCLRLEVPRKWDAIKVLGPEVANYDPDHLEVVLAAFAPQYYGYNQAITMLDDDWFSVAINPNVLLVGSREDHLVYWQGEAVARITRGVLNPFGATRRRARRMLKYFEGGVRLCTSETSR
jgi:hypothetical protein